MTEHSKNVDEYKELHDDIQSIAFLIEIPISKNTLIGMNVGFQREQIKGRRFPVTTDMIRVIKEISNRVDYTIISIMHENYKGCPFAVYALDNSKLDESVSSQLKTVYRSFTYDWQMNPFKTEVKLNLEKSNPKNTKE